MWLMLGILVFLLTRLLPDNAPHPTPTAPPRKKRQPRRRPHWVAEIKAGKHKPPIVVQLDAESEGDALMQLLAAPHHYAPRDILSLSRRT